MSPPLLDLDTASLDDFKRLLQSLVEEMGRLRAENSGLRDEIARLKGLPAKPKLKPSGMEKKTERAEVKRRRKQKRRGAKALADTVTETRVIAAAVPAGARFKGYQDFLVEDWVVNRRVVRLRRERWLLADGVLAAGLDTARWITVDDTGARHGGINQTCTQIGDDMATNWSGRQARRLSCIQHRHRRPRST